MMTVREILLHFECFPLGIFNIHSYWSVKIFILFVMFQISVFQAVHVFCLITVMSSACRASACCPLGTKTTRNSLWHLDKSDISSLSTASDGFKVGSTRWTDIMENVKAFDGRKRCTSKTEKVLTQVSVKQIRRGFFFFFFVCQIRGYDAERPLTKFCLGKIMMSFFSAGNKHSSVRMLMWGPGCSFIGFVWDAS